MNDLMAILFLVWILVFVFLIRFFNRLQARSFLDENFKGIDATFYYFIVDPKKVLSPNLKAFGIWLTAISESQKLPDRVSKNLPKWFGYESFIKRFNESLDGATFEELVNELPNMIFGDEKLVLAFRGEFLRKIPDISKSKEINFHCIYKAMQFYSVMSADIFSKLNQIYLKQGEFVNKKIEEFLEKKYRPFVVMQKIEELRKFLHGENAFGDYNSAFVGLQASFNNKIWSLNKLEQESDFKKAFDFMKKYSNTDKFLKWLLTQDLDWVEKVLKS